MAGSCGSGRWEIPRHIKLEFKILMFGETRNSSHVGGTRVKLGASLGSHLDVMYRKMGEGLRW